MRLATFNILHGRSLRDGLVDPDRLAAAVAVIDADVLGLQEVDRDQERSSGHDLTAAAARGMSAKEWRFEPALVGVPGGAWRAATDGDHEPGRGEAAYGVALLTRLPVLEWFVVRLPAARVRAPVLVPGSRRPLWIADEPRVALAARVETSCGPVTVATTHLSFVPGWNAWQLRLLGRALRALPAPTVLLGDLNMLGRTPALASGFRALAAAKTYPTARPRVQLDHVLARGPLPPVVGTHVLALPVSDHRALAVDLAEPGARA